jgi:hypothetical protein
MREKRRDALLFISQQINYATGARSVTSVRLLRRLSRHRQLHNYWAIATRSKKQALQQKAKVAANGEGCSNLPANGECCSIRRGLRQQKRVAATEEGFFGIDAGACPWPRTLPDL